MNQDSVDIFTSYFGSPGTMYGGLALALFLAAGFAWMIIIIKSWKDRQQSRVKDDIRVLWVVMRGLLMLLLIVAFFMSR